MQYVALQVKTSYSLLESLNQIPQLVQKAKDLNYQALAITDHNNMFGAVEFYNECQKHQIKPLIGLELDIDFSQIILIAKTNLGYQNLLKLSTIKSERNLTIEDLQKYQEDLILILPYPHFEEKIYNIYQDKYIGYKNQEEKNKITYPKIFINEVSYLNKNDYPYLDYLYMIKDSKVLGEYELNTHQGKHLLSEEEINTFVEKEELSTYQDIINKCNVNIDYTPNLLPIYDKDINAYEYLTKLCQKGLARRLHNQILSNYQQRLNYELSIINQMGFCNYFLIVWDYVKYAKQNNILVGPGRGSAAGSLVSYTLGITDIDPIKYNLLFERFLNPERVTMPDIDIDFDSEKRNEVIDYVTQKYGEKKVAGIITFNTLGAKQAIRDTGRVMGISLSIIDDITKQLTDTLANSYQTKPALKRLIDSNHSLTKLYNIALHLEGLPRHVSVHAAGIVMSNQDIDKTIPLYKNQLGMYVTGYSMNYLEPLGLLKMDFLGLSNLTLIDDVITNIRTKENLNITFQNIPLTDSKTFTIFQKVETDGIFQFESPGMRNFLQKLKPNSLEDIIAALALYRPGPMDNIDTYIKRKEGKERITYLHPDLEEILRPTYGIIIYQEQIMQIASTLAGYSYGEADILRRAMSKKKEAILLKEKPKFIQKSKEKGYSEEIATQVYDLILKFANYGFNRSHSVAYALIAYKMAFLKTYFLNYFLASILTNVIGSDSKTKTYILEAKTHHLQIKNPHINKSTNKYIVDNSNKNTILCPLSIIKNVGTSISNDIIKERVKAPFKNFIDFVKRTKPLGLSQKVIESLIYAGCFDELGYNQKTLINNLDNIQNYAELSQDIGFLELEEPLIDIFEEYTKEELIEHQFATFGYYLSDHPVTTYKKSDNINTQTIPNYFDKNIEIVLMITNIKEVFTKKNDIMAFLTTEDEYSQISVTLFPTTYQNNKNLKKNNIIKVQGKVERRFDKYQIVANKIELLNKISNN